MKAWIFLLCIWGAFGVTPSNVEVISKSVDSPLEDIQWIGEEVVMVLTEKGQIWRSQDSGKTFKNVMPKLTPEDDPTHAYVKSLHISHADNTHIFLVGASKYNWASVDQGKTWSACEKELHDVRLHPTQKNYLLGATMSPGCKSRSKGDCYKKLWVSRDFCKNWEEIEKYVVQYDWAPAFGHIDGDGRRPSDDLVYATTHSKKTGNQKFGFWDKDINFVQTADYFKSFEVVVPHGNRFLFGEHAYLFVAAVDPLHESQVQLMISRSNATHKLFQRAVLPVELTQHSYTILDTSEGSVFVHVNHQPFSEGSLTGHVYISDASGLVYSLSLPYNRRNSDGKCDFEKVEGLEGIYLANFIDDGDTYDAEISAMEEESEEDQETHRIVAKPHKIKHQKIKTVITFDKGGVWSYLEAPKHDSNGHEIACGPACHLHLHGVTDMYGPFYSSANAVGLIMATGTVSRYLHEQQGEINTYLSRDAGLTWAEVHKGSHIYEFGDHGALIVMADDTKYSDSILYSWDSGHTWTSLKIHDTPFQIENIIIEPTATSQVFVVYGWQETSGVLVYLNFADLHEKECVGADKPGETGSNYEVWTPSDGRLGVKCLMGHTVNYVRRKAHDACYNPETYQKQVFVSHCTCTAEDFECDYGYERQESTDANGNKVLNGPCVPMSIPPVHVDPFADRPCVHTKRVTKGYRRVAGDTCVGGGEWDAHEMPCPTFLTGGSFGKIILILFVIVAATLCLASVGHKFNLFDPCLQRCQGLYKEYVRVDQQTAGSVHGLDGEDYLSEDEFNHGAALLSQEDGLNKKDNKPAGKEPDLKPLPQASAAPASVPVLAAPRGDADDEFNPRIN